MLFFHFLTQVQHYGMNKDNILEILSHLKSAQKWFIAFKINYIRPTLQIDQNTGRHNFCFVVKKK
jgi:hypothetical protein